MASYWFDRADEMERRAVERPDLADMFREFASIYRDAGEHEQEKWEQLYRPSLMQRLKNRVGLF